MKWVLLVSCVHGEHPNLDFKFEPTFVARLKPMASTKFTNASTSSKRLVTSAILSNPLRAISDKGCLNAFKTRDSRWFEDSPGLSDALHPICAHQAEGTDYNIHHLATIKLSGF
jgi:hypothetical protein